MDLIIKATHVGIDAGISNEIDLDIRGADSDQILESISINDVISFYTAKKLLEAIGTLEIVQEVGAGRLLAEMDSSDLIEALGE